MNIETIKVEKYEEIYLKEIRNIYEIENWPHSKLDLQMMFANCNSCYVAIHKNEVVGFIRAHSDLVYSTFVFDIIVSDKYRGLGIAKKLIDMVQDEKQTRLDVVFDHNLTEFYQKRGFMISAAGIRFSQKNQINNHKN